jgi:serine/alanine adding enzyme
MSGTCPNMKIVNTLDEQTWRQFVEQHPQGNAFHTPEMFQVFVQAKNHHPDLWAVIGDDGKIRVLFLPVQITLYGGPLRRLTTRTVAYGGLLCDPSSADGEALAALLGAYANAVGREVLFTELRNLSDTNAIQPKLNQCGFVYHDHLNYLIDLNRPIEEVMKGIGTRTRKHIRQGLRTREVIVEEVSNRNQIKVWYGLVQASYTAARVHLADLSLFEAAFDILHPQGMIKFWLAHVGDVPVAASAELIYKDVMYGWYSGTDRTYSSYSPGELLMWHILEWGAENGYKVYDFGGAGTPQEKYGVREFKAKFGGKLVCFGRNTYVHAPHILNLSQLGYRLYRHWRWWKGKIQ